MILIPVSLEAGQESCHLFLFTHGSPFTFAHLAVIGVLHYFFESNRKNGRVAEGQNKKFKNVKSKLLVVLDKTP